MKKVLLFGAIMFALTFESEAAFIGTDVDCWESGEAGDCYCQETTYFFWIPIRRTTPSLVGGC